jgi:hypothetical protein
MWIGKPAHAAVALVKCREMTGRSQTLPWWRERGGGTDDRKQNTLSPFHWLFRITYFPVLSDPKVMARRYDLCLTLVEVTQGV